MLRGQSKAFQVYINRVFTRVVKVKSRVEGCSEALIVHSDSDQRLLCTLDSGINIGVRLLIFGLFSRGYVLIREGNAYFFSKYPLFDGIGDGYL